MAEITTLRRSCRLTEKRRSQKKTAERFTWRDSAPESSHPAPLTSNHSIEHAETVPDGTISCKKPSVTRPPNAFMLFRSDFWAKEKLKDKPIERDHRDISRIAAICWNNLSDEIKGVYRRKAEEQKELHRLQHPEYRFSPVRRETMQRKRRSRKCGSADTERCKRLAVHAMAEFSEGDHLREPRKSRKRRIEPIADQHGSNLVEIPSGKNKPEESMPELLRESIIGAIMSPTMPENDTTSGPSSINMERQIFQAASYDVVDLQFGQKPLLEQYIPEIRFWCTLGSSQDQVPFVDERGQLDPNAGVLDVGNQLRRAIFVRDMASIPSSFTEGNANMDYDVEMETYFQFDKDDDN